MVSNMENMTDVPSPDDAAAALSDADAARTRLTDGLVLPSFFYISIGAAVTAQITTAAVGLAVHTNWAQWLLIAGLAAFALVAALQLIRFRRRNGVWVGGLAGRVVLGTATTSSLSYALALGAAVWAGFEDLWWLLGICSLAGGVAYTLSGRRWLRIYREDPATHGRGESAWQLAGLGAVALTGMVFLVIGR